jgi:hypothetical protein
MYIAVGLIIGLILEAKQRKINKNDKNKKNHRNY